MRAAILVEEAVQDQEFWYPYYRLQEAGFEVEVAAPTLDKRHGKYGIPIQPTIKTSDLLKQAWELVVVPGGWGCPEKLRMDKPTLEFIKIMDALKKPIAAICHGPWVLISAGIVKGRRMTCYKGMKDDLVNAGAIYEEASVVVDDNIITSPHYNDNPAFMRALIEQLTT